jgi:hypothetical protein
MSTVILGEMSHIGIKLVKAVDQAARCRMSSFVRQHAADISYGIARSLQRITQRRGGICLPLSKEGATS